MSLILRFAGLSGTGGAICRRLKEMMAEIERAGCNVADVVRSGTTKRPRETRFIVPAMDCDYYADHLTRALKRLPSELIAAASAPHSAGAAGLGTEAARLIRGRCADSQPRR